MESSLVAFTLIFGFSMFIYAVYCMMDAVKTLSDDRQRRKQIESSPWGRTFNH